MMQISKYANTLLKKARKSTNIYHRSLVLAFFFMMSFDVYFKEDNFVFTANRDGTQRVILKLTSDFPNELSGWSKNKQAALYYFKMK